MAQKLLLTDGRKTINPLADSDEGWTVLSGEDNTSSAASLKTLTRCVPWLSRGVDAIADAVASMPFVVTQGETEVDGSKDWKNTAGFMENPRALLGKIAASLTLQNQAYLIKELNVNGYTRNLKYWLPSALEIVYDKENGNRLKAIVRKPTKKSYPVDANGICQVVYFWRSDTFTEDGPTPESAPAMAALAAALVLHNKDRFIAGYFKNGAIRVTLLSVDSNDKDEVEAFKHKWTDIATGIKNAWGNLVLRAKSITPTVIGGGLDELKENGLTAAAREDIATALGIPQTKMFSNAANYATAQADNVAFYTETIIPLCWVIQDVLNSQVFGPEGYAFKFMPETLQIFQDDEVTRAAALSTFFDIIGKAQSYDLFIEGCGVYGFTLSDKMLTAAKVWFDGKTERAAALTANLTQPKEPPAAPAEPTTPAEPTPAPGEKRAVLATWKRKAVNALNRGECANVEFESVALPARMVEAIHYELEEAKTAEEVKAVFARWDTEGLATAEDWAALREANEFVRALN